jgi:ADP-heptose:LPS heptosyltransferase
MGGGVKPLKVLVIRFSSIGDIVLTSPVVRCVKNQIKAEIHYLTKVGFADIVKPSPYVDKVYTIEKNVAEVSKALQNENYDLIIDLHKNLRSRELRWRLGKRSLSFNKANIVKWWLVRSKSRNRSAGHIVDRYMEALQILDVRYDGLGLDYFLQPEGTNFPQTVKPYICFAIGGTHFTKRLPVHKLIEVCRGLSRPVYLLGGQSDQETGDVIAGQIPQVINLCGVLSLSDSARLVKDAALILTHDTGLMHIAAAFRRPIVSIWGNTIPQFGMYPFLPDSYSGSYRVSEVENLPCRPCSKIGYDACPKGHFNCMQHQDVDWILTTARQELSNIRPI